MLLILYIISIFSLHAVLSVLHQEKLIAHHEVDSMRLGGTFTQTSYTIRIESDHLFLFLGPMCMVSFVVIASVDLDIANCL